MADKLPRAAATVDCGFSTVARDRRGSRPRHELSNRSLAVSFRRYVTVAYSPDGGRIAAAARDGLITIWDVSTTPQWTNSEMLNIMLLRSRFFFIRWKTAGNRRRERVSLAWIPDLGSVSGAPETPVLNCRQGGAGFCLFSPDGDDFIIAEK